MSNYILFDVTNSIRHEIPPGNTVLGRGADCTIRLLSSSVSRKHGALELNGDTLMYADLGSSNGSFVNDIQVKAPVQLQNGDNLVLGDFRFNVTTDAGGVASAAQDDGDATQLGGAPASAEIPAAWSESAGLENASGTQLGSFTDGADASAADAYRGGQLNLPPIGAQPRLIVINGDQPGTAFDLDWKKGQDKTWKLGRDAATTDIAIEDASISGQHAQLVTEEGRWKIVNWMSTNGTFVNGRKGLSAYLGSGDVIRMGNVELAFELPGKKNARPAASGAPAGGAQSTGSGGLMGFLKRLFGGKG